MIEGRAQAGFRGLRPARAELEIRALESEEGAGAPPGQARNRGGLSLQALNHRQAAREVDRGLEVDARVRPVNPVVHQHLRHESHARGREDAHPQLPVAVHEEVFVKADPLEAVAPGQHGCSRDQVAWDQ